TCVIARQVAAFMTDPEVSLRILKQAGQTVALQTWRICAVVNREMHPVETSQAGVGCEPKITVTGLHDRRDGILRQTVIGTPRPLEIIRLCGTWAAPGGGQAQQEYQYDEPRSCERRSQIPPA